MADNTDKKEYMKQYMKEYWKKYYQENKEYLLKQQKKYRSTEEYKTKRKKYNIEYYENNKEEMKQRSDNWRRKNPKKFSNLIKTQRKRSAEKLKEQGQIYCYLPKEQRELKMAMNLSLFLNISEDEAKKLLIQNNWNYKKILEEKKEGKI